MEKSLVKLLLVVATLVLFAAVQALDMNGVIVASQPEGQNTQGETIAVPEEPVVPKAAPTLVEPPVSAVEPLPALSEWLTVLRGSTMYKLAKQYRLGNTSVERMLVALYHVNADKFDGKNMNRIRAGRVLRLPDDGDLSSVTQFDAEKEIRVPVSDWHAYRQKLASPAAVS